MNRFLLLFIIFITFISKVNAIDLTQEEKDWIKNNPIVHVGTYEIAPYQFTNSSGELTGYQIDKMKTIIELVGLKPKFYPTVKLKKAIEGIKQDQYDLLLDLIDTKPRREIISFSNSTIKINMAIFTQKNNQSIKNTVSLKGKVIASYKEYAFESILKKVLPSAKIVQADDIEGMFRLVAKGEADACIQELYTGQYILSEAFIHNLNVKGFFELKGKPTLKAHEWGIRKELVVLKSILDKAEASLELNTKQKLWNKWFNTDDDKIKLNVDEKKYLKETKFNIYANNWEPFSSFDKTKNSFEGLGIDFLDYVSKALNLQYNIEYVENFGTMLKKVKNDSKGMLISTSYTDERASYANFSKPYISFPIGIATNKDEVFLIDLKSLNGKKVAVGKNYSAYNLLKKYYPKIEFVLVSNTTQALELLSKGEVYAAADILPVLKAHLNKVYYTNLKISGTSEFKLNIQFMINKDQEKFVPILNKAIDLIDQTTSYSISNKWNTKEIIIEKTDYKLFYYLVIGSLAIVLFLLWRHLELSKYKNALESNTKKLQESNDRLLLASKVSFDLLYEWDVKNDSLIWYGDIDSFLGYENGEISHNIQAWLNIIHPEDKRLLSDAVEKHRVSTEVISYEYRIKQKNGSYQYWKDQALPILDEQNKARKWIGVCTNQTSQKKAEVQLLEQSKMVAMGEMIGNIAHQWRQPLTVISTASTGVILHDELGTLNKEILLKEMNRINDNAQYLSKTIDDFKNFIQGNREKENFNLLDNINKFLHLVEGSIKRYDINIHLNIDENLSIDSYPNELNQCFINLFNNAKDELKEKTQERAIFIEAQIVDENLKIFFKDNAGGVPTEILHRIFDPYFTTKHQSQGTGLGLSMTHTLIVNGMDGSIEIENISFEYENKKYNGAEFIITLPL